MQQQLVSRAVGPNGVGEGSFTIGHPIFAIQLSVRKDGKGNINTASVVRTAWPLIEGVVYD